MWNFTKLLGISGYHVINQESDSCFITFHLKCRRITATCPICFTRSKTIRDQGRRRTIQHGTLLGKRCILVVQTRRFHCHSCSRVFTEQLSFIASRQRATIKHKKEVIDNLVDRSFSSGAKRYCISYDTQRKWLKELIAAEVLNFEAEEKENAPFTLGIDEVSFSGHEMVTTIANITTKKLKGVLRSKRKDELKRTLRSLSPHVKGLITEVVIDMCDLYLRTVKEVLPDAHVVVDHFHIISYANKQIDSQRLIIQDIFKKRIPRYLFMKNKENLTAYQIQRLDEVVKRYPELRMYWETKERLRTMYQAKTKEEAEEQLRVIITSLRSTDDGVLITWGNTLRYWKPYILNYWVNKSTNGFLEGMHNKMKLIKRISFGFKNKEVFINKVMLSVLISAVLLHT